MRPFRKGESKIPYVVAILVVASLVVVAALGYLDWAWVAILIPSSLIGAYLIVRGERAEWWTRKKKVNVIILVAFTAWLCVTVSIPSDWYGHNVLNNTVQLSNQQFSQHLNDTFLVRFKANITFSTNGIFSVGNPIHVRVVIFDSNDTRLYPHFHDVAFTNMSTISKNGLYLVPHSDGTFTAEGDIEFHSQLKTWMFLIPPSPTGYVNINIVLTPLEQAEVESQDPMPLIIGPQSDTQAALFNQFTVKLGFVFGSFSILLLQPIIEGIVLRDTSEASKATQQQKTSEHGPNLPKQKSTNEHDKDSSQQKTN